MVSFSSRRTEDDSADAAAVFFLGAMMVDFLIKASDVVGLCIAATDSMPKVNRTKQTNNDSGSWRVADAWLHIYVYCVLISMSCHVVCRENSKIYRSSMLCRAVFLFLWVRVSFLK